MTSFGQEVGAREDKHCFVSILIGTKNPRTCGKGLSSLSHTLKYTLQYILFYCEQDHDLQNQHRAGLRD